MSTSSAVTAESLHLKTGKHVLYVDAKHPDEPRDALIQIIFSELGYPMLTLVMIGGGERGIRYKTCVPHRTLHHDEPGWWIMPGEVNG